MSYRKLGFTFLAITVFSVSFAEAVGIEIPNPLKANTFDELVEAIINFVFNIALAIAPIMIVIAGFIFVTSGGDPKGVQRAKDILLYTVIGLSVVMLSKGLIVVVKQILTG